MSLTEAELRYQATQLGQVRGNCRSVGVWVGVGGCGWVKRGGGKAEEEGEGGEVGAYGGG